MTRRTLSAMDKIRILLAQDGRCACGCGEKLEAPHIQFDHHNQSSLSDDQSHENFRALSTDHHKVKTRLDAKARAKVKRIASGGKKRKGKPLQGRGFDKRLTKDFYGRVRERQG